MKRAACSSNMLPNIDANCSRSSSVCTWGDVDCEGDGFLVLTGAELPSVLIGLPGGVAT